MPAPTPEALSRTIEESVTRARLAVTKALDGMAPYIDRDPKGLDAVCLAATLRLYADIIESQFGEGNAIGPLKQMVDEVRQRMLLALQKRG